MSSPLSRRRLTSLALLIGLLSSVIAPRAAVAQSGAATKTLRVLFIGNSYTYFNNLGDIVAGIAAVQKNGPRIVPTLAVHGGITLRWHLENGPAMSLLESGGWDYVVLQEHSLLGADTNRQPPVMGGAANFHESTRELVRRIRAVKAEPILFMTWARRDHLEQQKDLANAYIQIGKELGVTVAPVGLAWTEARRRWLSMDLHIWDESHPTPYGSYLAGCVLYASLTGMKPEIAAELIEGHPIERTTGVVDFQTTVPLVDIRPATAKALQEVAWQTVEDLRH